MRAAVDTTTITSEELAKDPSAAITADANGPVFISEHGVHAFAFVSIEEYRESVAKVRPCPICSPCRTMNTLIGSRRDWVTSPSSLPISRKYLLRPSLV